MTRSQHQQLGALGAHVSWENTTDRTARTANGRSAGPGEIEWHLARLDPVRFANATDAQRLAAAGSAKKAYFARLALKSAKARQRKS